MRIALLCVALAACSAVDERDASADTGPDASGDTGLEPVGCPSLDCLAGSAFRYRPTRTLDAPTATTLSGDLLPESAYRPIDVGTSHEVTFSTDLARVDIVAIINADRHVGKSPSREPQRITYELDAFAGGRFAVWIDDGQTLEAELTLFGSGVPIVESSRGVLEATDRDQR